MESLLTKRVQTVICEGATSPSSPVTPGVPQGSVPGPLLFLKYINGLTSTVKLFDNDTLLYGLVVENYGHFVPWPLRSKPLRSILWSLSLHLERSDYSLERSDYLVERSDQGWNEVVWNEVVMEDCDNLQDDLNKLEIWQHEWQMQFNPSKCIIICISNKQSPPQRTYFFCGSKLERVDSASYLGITVNSELKWSKHISSISSKVSRSLGLIQRNLWNCPRKVRETAYTSIVQPKPWREFKRKLLVFDCKISTNQQVWQTCYPIWNGTH